MASTAPRRSLTLDNINPHVRAAKYAVRGELAVRSEQYRAQLAQQQQGPPTPDQGRDGKPLPFDTVISANIGNPQQLDQQPLTFFRQVASLCENPALLQHEDVLRNQLGYGADVVDRARWLLRDVKSVGAYSQSQGTPGIRASVAKFIEGRDGYPADWNNIYLSTGASSAVNTLLHIICASPQSGILVPIPQYPLYTATLSVLDARCVPYYLNEEKHWGTDLSAIRDALATARNEGTDVRAIVIINPGNPTGASLASDDITAVLEFAAAERLVVIADEVYQTNIFEGTFTSFKKGLRELQHSDANRDARFDTLELASLHSVSKGMVGECGHRGGYMELVGFDRQVQEQIYKFISIQLCPPILGQIMVELMCNPPKPGDPSFALYDTEYRAIFNGLHERALALYHAFAQMEGVACQTPTGSMYLFPTITLPPKAVEAARAEGRAADEFYCLRLLDTTGICVVPGSGFGQRDHSLHFRTTFLAPGTDWVRRIVEFHRRFMDEFRG